MAANDRDELLKQRIILVIGPIHDEGATEVIARLLYLDHVDPKAPVQVVVDSPGGSFAAGMAILDTMDRIGPPVHTSCAGGASGMALAVVAHGAKGHRTASPGATFTLTPIWSPETGEQADEQLQKDRHDFVRLLAGDTKRSEAAVRDDMKKSKVLSAAEAHDYGVIDAVEDPARPGQPWYRRLLGYVTRP